MLAGISWRSWRLQTSRPLGEVGMAGYTLDYFGGQAGRDTPKDIHEFYASPWQHAPV